MPETPVLTPEIASNAAPEKTARRGRVLHIINGEHYAGAERVQDLLALRLPEFDYEVSFACLKPGKFNSARRAQESRLFNLPMRSRFDLRQATRLARLIRSEGFDLIHTHTPRAALIGRIASARTRTPHVHHLHSPTIADTTHRLRNIANASIERASLWGVSGVIAVSNSLGEHARRLGISMSRLAVLHNGVPCVGPLARKTPPQGCWNLGVVALFRPRKGLEVLLEALARVRGDGHDVTLRAVGPFETPEYEREIKALAETHRVGGAIEWRGFQSDVLSELRAMDVFVLPSLFGEGLPMVVLEAMAAGAPVVSTRVEGIPEAVRHGIDGLISEPGNAKDLADAILKFVTGEADYLAMRESAHARQAESFSDETMARGVAAFYDRILKR